MKERVAHAVNRALAVNLRSGAVRPPGAGRVLRITEADGRELAAACHGDTFLVFHGRKVITEFSMSPQAAVRLLRFLLAWWVFGTWMGLKPALWYWSIRVLLDEEQKRIEARWHKPKIEVGL